MIHCQAGALLGGLAAVTAKTGGMLALVPKLPTRIILERLWRGSSMTVRAHSRRNQSGSSSSKSDIRQNMNSDGYLSAPQSRQLPHPLAICFESLEVWEANGEKRKKKERKRKGGLAAHELHSRPSKVATVCRFTTGRANNPCSRSGSIDRLTLSLTSSLVLSISTINSIRYPRV